LQKRFFLKAEISELLNNFRSHPKPYFIPIKKRAVDAYLSA